MFDLIIRRARLTDDSLADIAIRAGKIAEIGQIPGPAKEERDLRGNYYLSAGWIDSHVHCYPKSPIYHDEADRIGIEKGVTTVIDAGSTGADDIDDFYRLSRFSSTQVYALMNISRTGIATQDELADLDQIDAQAVIAAVKRRPDFIVGIKARMSSSVVGPNGIEPLRRAKAIQQAINHLPLMVHIGNSPPDIDEIAPLLSSGDIITHCYHGKPNRILTPESVLRGSIKQAIQRGVRLDVGYGSASFNFQVARAAIKQGILPDTISSDIYCRNRLNGPVYGLSHVMSTFLNLGMTLSQIINCVTVQAAQNLRLTQKGRLEPGMDADLTIFTLTRAPILFVDAEGEQAQGKVAFAPHATVVAGKWYLTEEGKTNHEFSI